MLLLFNVCLRLVGRSPPRLITRGSTVSTVLVVVLLLLGWRLHLLLLLMRLLLLLLLLSLLLRLLVLPLLLCSVWLLRRLLLLHRWWLLGRRLGLLVLLDWLLLLLRLHRNLETVLALEGLHGRRGLVCNPQNIHYPCRPRSHKALVRLLPYRGLWLLWWLLLRLVTIHARWCTSCCGLVLQVR